MIIILLVQQRQPPLVLTTTSPFLKIIIYPANGLLSYGVSPLNIFRNIVTQVHKFMNPLPTSYAVYNLHKLLIAHLAPHVPSFREREILPTYGKLELNKIRPSEISFRLSILRAFAIPFSEHIQNPTKWNWIKTGSLDKNYLRWNHLLEWHTPHFNQKTINFIQHRSRHRNGHLLRYFEDDCLAARLLMPSAVGFFRRSVPFPLAALQHLSMNRSGPRGHHYHAAIKSCLLFASWLNFVP